MTERRKIDWFEWARVLGALAIVALHAMRVTELAPGLAAAHARLFGVEAVLQIPLARWAVPVFLMVSGALLLDPGRKMPPRKIAEILTQHLELEGSWFDSAEIAGPGFLNFRVSDKWYADVLAAVEAEGPAYGRAAARTG